MPLSNPDHQFRSVLLRFGGRRNYLHLILVSPFKLDRTFGCLAFTTFGSRCFFWSLLLLEAGRFSFRPDSCVAVSIYRTFNYPRTRPSLTTRVGWQTYPARYQTDGKKDAPWSPTPGTSFSPGTPVSCKPKTPATILRARECSHFVASRQG